jgi:hypothetical protein
MSSNMDAYKQALERLVRLGDEMVLDLQIRHRESQGDLPPQLLEAKKEFGGAFESKYQNWYTEATAVIRQLTPERSDEFRALYEGDPRRKDINLSSYAIRDWLVGIRAGSDLLTREKLFDDFAAVTMRFQTQQSILKSAAVRFDSRLYNIKQLLQADLFDSELDAATELKKNGYLRAGGVITGVVLETHLAQVCQAHGLKTRKRNPTISDYNDLLKQAEVVDIPQWRFIQRLADIRNLSAHKKQREPTEDEIEEMLEGVDKTVKTLS